MNSTTNDTSKNISPKTGNACEEPKQHNHSQMWDKIAEETKVDRFLCKRLIYAMLFGLCTMDVITEHGLSVDQVVEIRMAFDECSHRISKELPYD